MLSFLLKKADINEDISLGNTKITSLIRILIFISVLSCFTHPNAARAVVGAVALFFLILPQTRKHLFDYRGSKIILVFLSITSVVALINANYMGFLAALMFLGMLIVTNTARSFMTEKFYEGILDFMCIGSVFAGVYSIFEKFVIYKDVPDYRAMAWFPNPNFFGATLMLVILVCAYKIVKGGKYSVLYLFVAIINGIGILNCESMSLWLIAFIGVFMLLLLSRKYLLLSILLTFTAAVVAVMYFYPHLFERLDEIEGTTNNRILIWNFAIEQFKEVPIFGRGFFSYRHLYNIYKDVRFVYKAALCHNILLDSLLCHGIVGTSIAGTFFIQYLRDMFSYRKRLKQIKGNRLISTFIISVFIALAFYGIIDTTLVWIQGGTVLLLIASGIGVEEKATT